MRCVSRAGLLRRMQRTRPGHRPRHQHLRRALMTEIAIGEAHARNRAAEVALVFLVEVEAGFERNALDRRADGLAANLKRIAGQPHVVSLPAAYHTNHGNIGAAWLVKSEQD